ncbi:MAG: hypothetical protein ACQESE_04420 [Nanobdellota archaeon]
MAAKKKTTTAAIRSKKKKKWFPLVAPKTFNEASLGECYLTDSELLNDRYITANMSTISGNMRKNNTNIQFKVIAVKDGKAYCRTVGFSMINAAIKRLVKRGRDKISDSFLVKTKDKEVVRVKPLIITNNRGTKSIQSAIRLEARRVIRDFAFSKSTEELFSDMASAKLQKLVKEKCVKFYPTRSVDIRMAKLEEHTKIVVTEKAIESEPVKRRVKDVEGKKHIPEEELEKQRAAQEESAEEETELEADSDENDSEDFGEKDSADSSDKETEKALEDEDDTEKKDE